MKKVKWWMVGLVLVLSAASVKAEDKAGDPAAAVPTVVGELKPKFSVELSDTEFNGLARTLSTIRRYEGPNVDINSLFDREDQVAAQMMADEVRSRLLAFGTGLADLRAIVYKANLYGNFLSDRRTERKTLMKGYKIAADQAYATMLERLTSVNGGVETALGKCSSEMCVIYLSGMIEELQVLGRRMDRAFRKGKMSRKEVLFSFESEFNRKLIADLVNGLIDKEDPYALLVATGLAGLYEAGNEAKDLRDTWKVILGLDSANRTLEFKVAPLQRSFIRGNEKLLRYLTKENLMRVSASIATYGKVEAPGRRVAYDCEADTVSFMAVVYGQRWYSCDARDSDVPQHLSVVMRTVGVGFEVNTNGVVDDGPQKGVLIFTKRKYSPAREILRKGRTWVGLGGSLAPFFPLPGVGFGTTVHGYAFGPKGSVASFYHVSVAAVAHFGGASVGIQSMTIRSASLE